MTELYIVPNDPRCKPYIARIDCIGRKYISIVGRIRFDKNTFPYESVEDRNGWNPRLTAYKSKEQYERLQLLNTELSVLRQQIRSFIDKCDDKIILSTIVSYFNNSQKS